MASSLFHGRNPMLNMIKQMKGNPNAMLNMMAQNNPQVRQIMDMVNTSQMTPKDLFFKMANQKGVDPNEIIDLLK